MDYAVNRFYSAAQGRFTQVDPIGMRGVSLSDPQSLNLYSYVQNDPVNFIDPRGTGIIAVTSCVTLKFEGEIIGIDCETVYYITGGGPVALPFGGIGDGGGGIGGGGGSSGGNNNQSTNNAKEIAKCFGKGLLVGAVGALAVGALAVGAVALGAPVAVVTSVLGVAAVVGFAAFAVNTRLQVEDRNYAGIAYNAGSLVGGVAVGASSGGWVANGIKPGATLGLSWSSNIAQRYRPSLGSVGQWLGTGPTKASAGGATAAAGTGVGVAANRGC